MIVKLHRTSVLIETRAFKGDSLLCGHLGALRLQLAHAGFGALWGPNWMLWCWFFGDPTYGSIQRCVLSVNRHGRPALPKRRLLSVRSTKSFAERSGHAENCIEMLGEEVKIVEEVMGSCPSLYILFNFFLQCQARRMTLTLEHHSLT